MKTGTAQTTAERQRSRIGLHLRASTAAFLQVCDSSFALMKTGFALEPLAPENMLIGTPVGPSLFVVDVSLPFPHLPSLIPSMSVCARVVFLMCCLSVSLSPSLSVSAISCTFLSLGSHLVLFLSFNCLSSLLRCWQCLLLMLLLLLLLLLLQEDAAACALVI